MCVLKLYRPCRPTTLELGNCNAAGVGGGTGAACTPPPVPPRWSRSTLLTPLSLPSSVQSTPSEVQSTFSEKSSRPGKKKKRNSGGNKAESIHYKDTEILDLFKGVSTAAFFSIHGNENKFMLLVFYTTLCNEMIFVREFNYVM